ncbi:MASE3 domain-containing protein [Radiobacillus sp. PE A8.2]|uniref:MASE3 domain-containing protein n=1 Tax=Radiobacillus sp. PE A8.2 TaxID=3380349 RepID=UPI003890DB2E
MTFKFTEAKVIIISFLALFFLLFIHYGSEVFSHLYNPENITSIHTILELFSICMAIAIFTYGYKTFPFTKSRQLFFLSFLFFTVAFLDLLHMISFEDMPDFITESSMDKSVWFGTLARLVQAISLVWILLLSDKKVIKDLRIYYFASSIAIVSFIGFIIYRYEAYLPPLSIENQGNTLLKDIIGYVICALLLVTILIVIKRYIVEKKDAYLYIALALWSLLMAEVAFDVYSFVNDIDKILAHIFKVMGFFYIIKGFYFSTIDEAKEAEAQVRAVKQELHDVLREQLGIISTIVKQNGKFIHTLCDGELLYKLGLTVEDTYNKSVDEFFVTPHNIKTVNTYLNRAWNSKEKITFEIKHNNLDMLISIKPIIVKGKVVKLVGSVTDVTKIKEMEEVIRDIDRFKLVAELAAGVAHEIRNPLTTVKGFLHLLNERNDEKDQTFVKVVLAELDRIESITNEFMDLSRPKSSKFKDEDLVEILKQVILFLEPSATKLSVTIHFNYIKGMKNVHCQKNQMKQVFINFIKNAMEAMPKGGNLYIDADQDLDHTRIRFTDEGVGIPEELIDQVGNAFFTMKETGNGLGVMMSKRIIEEHKGFMEISSKEGEGTSIVLTLPTVNQFSISLSKQT